MFRQVHLVIALQGLIVVLQGSVFADDPEIDRAIAKHRMGTLLIHAAAGDEVKVEQLRHEFWFGAAISSRIFAQGADPQTAEKYKEVFLENFNCGVTENALKWHAMERRQGEVDYSIVDAMLTWTDQHDIPLRGHNIFWGVSNRVQDWQKAMDDQQLLATLEQRAIDIGKRYRGRFAEYDLNNEMMHNNYYEERLGPTITKQMAAWVKQEDPDAVLYLNDYDILTGNKLAEFVAHIRKLLDQGVAIDGIGVQGHLHAESFDPDALQNALDALAQFDMPIRITEFNLPGQRSRYYPRRRGSQRVRPPQMTPAEEEARAKAIVDYYRICFAHPAVDGILMWGFWEGANWIPASSLYKRDWTPTPAAHAYRKLIYDQWWTRWTGTAGANGRCELPAFYGRYRVTAGGIAKTVNLRSADGRADVRF
jgi:GH35 family endo-1,4-beta-xylanase